MPTYKDEKTGTWYCKFYYTDWQGNKKQKLKRGFKLQRDAKDWERQFLEQQQGSPDMSFSAMCELFLDDKKAHAKLSSYKSEKGRLEAWVIPYFKDKPLNGITAADIRKWQAELKTATGANEKLLSPSYLHNIVMECSAVFNFAVKYYGLARNPCRIAGDNIGKKVKSVQFWTREEFNQFIDTFDKSDPFYTAFLVLYYTGMRIGDDDDKIRLNQRKPSKYKGLRRFGPEKNLQRINKFMKERPIFYKNLIQMKENIRFYLRCFYCITKVMILQFNSENRTELARNG